MTTRRQILKKGAAIAATLSYPTLFSSISAASSTQNTLVYSGVAFGSTWNLTLSERHNAIRAINTIADVVEQIDLALSPYRTDSELLRFNKQTESTAVISNHFRNVVAAGLTVAKRSSGAFDPTVGPIANRYGFSPIKGKLDSHFSELTLNHSRLSKQYKNTTLDLCGIAKGYALDLIADSLESLDYTDFLIELGGEIIARGNHPSGRAWNIQIQAPDEETAVGLSFELQDNAIATSGIANNSYKLNNRRYSHLVNRLDPNSNQSDLYSVSVAHDNAMFADAWSTALFVLGYKRGAALAKKLSLDTLFIQESSGRYKTTTINSVSRVFNV